MSAVTLTHSDASRLRTALLFALGLHLFLIFGVHFRFEPPPEPARIQRSLEVLVVQHPREPSEKSPDPDYLAQITQDGEGNPEAKKRPAAQALEPEEPATEHVSLPPLELSTPRGPTLERKKLVEAAATEPKPAVPPPPAPVPDSVPAQAKRPSLSQLLASSRHEAERITAELDRKSQIYAQRPRRKHISAQTQEYKYAAYLEAWRRKVERIGNLNYPDEAKRRKLYGNLVLAVTLRPDGTVDDIRLLRSSGHKLLDDAAKRIVELASPYAPFPPEIREQTDLLEITRTWQFLSSNQLFSEN